MNMRAFWMVVVHQYFATSFGINENEAELNPRRIPMIIKAPNPRLQKITIVIKIVFLALFFNELSHDWTLKSYIGIVNPICGE
jgi:hypothetical protein